MAKYNDLTVGQMEAAINMMGGWDNFLEFLRGNLIVKAKGVIHQTVKVLVDYGRSVSDGITAGKYDWVEDSITEKNIPTTQSDKAELEIQLLYFGKYMNTELVFVEMEKQNLRPATLQELLAIGEKYPEIQREFPVVALGSFWVDPDGHERVPCFYGRGRERELHLVWDKCDWGGRCRFAAVSK